MVKRVLKLLLRRENLILKAISNSKGLIMNTKELPKSKTLIDDKEMAYVDIGAGETMLFLMVILRLLIYGEILCHIFLVPKDVLHQI